MTNLPNITSVCALSALLASSVLPALPTEGTGSPTPQPPTASGDLRLPPSSLASFPIQLLTTSNEWVGDPRVSKGYSSTAYRFLKDHPEAESLLTELKQTQADVIAIGNLTDVAARNALGYTATYAVSGIWGRHAKVGLIAKNTLQTHSLFDPRKEYGVESDIVYDTGKRVAEIGDTVIFFGHKNSAGEIWGRFIRWPNNSLPQ